MFPRYEIGDIIRLSSKRNDWEEHHLILEGKFSATQTNMPDIYLTLCLEYGTVRDEFFQDTIYTKVDKVA